MKTLLGSAALLLPIFPVSLPFAADDSPDQLIRQLAGTWKQNEAKRKLGSELSLRFRTNAGQLEELRGPESRPVIQPVNFGGKPHEDGGMTIVWKQTGPNSYERTLSAKGKLLTTRRISVASDGKALKEEFEQKLADGKTVSRTSEFSRVSGEGKGLAGTWKVTSIRNSQPPVIKYVAAGKNALRVSTPLGQEYLLTLDGKPAPITGAAVIPDMMITGRIVDATTIETTTTRQGVPATRARIQLSEGGNVMTVTTTNLGPNANAVPSVTVFDKQ